MKATRQAGLKVPESALDRVRGFVQEKTASGRGLPRYPERGMMIYLVFLAFVVARYIQLGARRDILATVRFEFLLGLLVIALVSHQLSVRKPLIGDSKNLLILIGLLFLVMLFHIPFAAAPVRAQDVFMDRVIKFAFMTYFMVVLIESPKYLKLFLAAFMFSVFYITFESVRGLRSGGLVWESQGIMRLHGAVPIYMHPNSLGGVAMGALPYAAFLVPQFKNRFIQLGLLATAGTATICVIYSGSRTAYVGLLAFVLWWFFQTEKKRRFLLYGLVLGAVFLNSIPDQYIERFESIGGQEKEGRSKEARIDIMRDALVILGENPLGVGVASFPEVRRAKFGRAQDTHNLYLEVATNLGVQGFIVFMALVTVMLIQLRRSMFSFRRQRRHVGRLIGNKTLDKETRQAAYKHDRDLQFLVATAKATGGFIVGRLVLGFFGMDLYEVYWWFGAGLAIVMAGLVVRTKRRTTVLLDTAGADHPASQP